jgi:hypothetical protein
MAVAIEVHKLRHSNVHLDFNMHSPRADARFASMSAGKRG